MPMAQRFFPRVTRRRKTPASWSTDFVRVPVDARRWRPIVRTQFPLQRTERKWRLSAATSKVLASRLVGCRRGAGRLSWTQAQTEKWQRRATGGQAQAQFRIKTTPDDATYGQDR